MPLQLPGATRRLPVHSSNRGRLAQCGADTAAALPDCPPPVPAHRAPQASPPPFATAGLPSLRSSLVAPPQFLESYAYYSLSYILLIYLSDEFGYTDIEAGPSAHGSLCTASGVSRCGPAQKQ